MAVDRASAGTVVASARGVTLSRGGRKLLDDVSLELRAGEVLALLGPNGAGKSTLLGVLSGDTAPDGGDVEFRGRPISEWTLPELARRRSVLLQDNQIMFPFTVHQVVEMGRAPWRRTPLEDDDNEAIAEAIAAADIAHLGNRRVPSLSGGERARVGFARVVAGRTGVLMLDEPTAALGKAETESLHALIQDFAARGVSVLYVSHRLPDILEVCTRIVVLRGGKLVVDGPASDFTPAKLAEALVPDLRSLDFTHVEAGDEILRVQFGQSDVVAHAGEVVGLFGMAGGEQFDLAAQLAGAAAQAHEYELQGATVRFKSPDQAIRRGVFFVPPDRDTEGLIATETGVDNVMLPWYAQGRSRGWWVSARSGVEIYQRAREALDIRGPAGEAAVSQFSGGNRQKHLLARWLYPAQPTLLILSQPTQGVDVGAKLDIVEAARAAAHSGAAVIVASSESDEIASMCDRAYTLQGDRTVEVPRTSAFNESLLGSLLSLAAHASD